MTVTTEGQVLDVLRQGLMLALKLAGPMLLVSIVVGLVISIFQAATQIHEQTLTFVPKVVVMALLLLLSGSWMIGEMRDFVYWLFAMMTRL